MRMRNGTILNAVPVVGGRYCGLPKAVFARVPPTGGRAAGGVVGRPRSNSKQILKLSTSIKESLIVFFLTNKQTNKHAYSAVHLLVNDNRESY